MSLRSGHVVRAIVVFALLVASVVLPKAARCERYEVSTRLGTIELPDYWMVERVSDVLFRAMSEDGVTRITLMEKEFEPISDYLHRRADELRISRYLRKVHEEYQNEVGADRGFFIQGLVPENDDVATVPGPEDWKMMDWEAVDGIAARYLFVVAYKANDRLYVMEAETLTESGGTLLLSEIHRSWILPEMSISR